jgi:hypothetical protein
MTVQETDPDLTSADMAQLRAEFQRMGMTPAQAAEAAAILARLAGRLPCMERAMNRMLANIVDIGATPTWIEARLTEMAERGRRRVPDAW